MADHETCPDGPEPSTALAEVSLPTLAQIRESPDDFVGKVDIAVLNLRCAEGLPGAEDLDICASLAKIDDWTDKVRHATSRNYDLFNRRPDLFDGSLGKFYMAVLCTTLQRECGVGYNPEQSKNPNARNSQDRFLHGITHGAGGTCASLPVLYAAVGRRMDYPLKIVGGARHLYLRWDESDRRTSLATDRFNIEATAKGFVSYPDVHYLIWPYTHPAAEADPREFLRSFTPREELAEFLSLRSVVLMENGKYVQAIEAAAFARHVDPDDYSHKVHLETVMLAALGILPNRPAWMDEQPVVRPDGTSWNRFWWPQRVENPELLAIAKLPPFVLGRLLPPGYHDAPYGALADPLYERVSLYADEAKSLQLYRAIVTHEQNAAEALRLNVMNLARERARHEEMLSRPKPNGMIPPPQPVPGWHGGHQPAAFPPHVGHGMPGLPQPQHGNGLPSQPAWMTPNSPGFHPQIPEPPTFPPPVRPIPQMAFAPRHYGRFALSHGSPDNPFG